MEAEKQEKTDNELIAEFMGILFDDDGRCTDPERKYSWRPGTYDSLRIEHLQYNSSWGWIIPVVEKMSEFGVWTLRPGFAAFESYGGELRTTHKFKFIKSTTDFETDDDSPIEWVFIVACVCLDGIKWYNRQK